MPFLQKLDGRFRRKVLIEPLVIHLKHGCVDAGTEALDLGEGEEPVRAHFVHANADVLLGGGDTFANTTDHARCRSAELNVVLAWFRPVEHRVERSDLVYLHRLHLEDLSDLVHG